MATTFDPNVFLNQTFDEANSTESVPCPVGEYLAIADKVELKTWASGDGSASGLKLEILWDLQDENVKELLGRASVKVRQQQMLDMTEDGKTLDFGKGKNVGLGRIRAALDLNTPGEAFSFPMIQGRMGKVMVSHRPDKNDPAKMYDEIKAVTKAG